MSVARPLYREGISWPECYHSALALRGIRGATTAARAALFEALNIAPGTRASRRLAETVGQ